MFSYEGRFLEHYQRYMRSFGQLGDQYSNITFLKALAFPVEALSDTTVALAASAARQPRLALFCPFQWMIVPVDLTSPRHPPTPDTRGKVKHPKQPFAGRLAPPFENLQWLSCTFCGPTVPGRAAWARAKALER